MPPVPNLAGMQPSAAFSEARKAGLQPVVLGLPVLKTADGTVGYAVAAQDPQPGTDAERSSRVLLAFEHHILSLGTLTLPEQAPVGTPAPDVVGAQLERAVHRVTSEGFVAVVDQPKRPVESTEVSRQEPAAGEPIGPFREVVMWID